MICRASQLIQLCFVCICANSRASIYEVPENHGDVVGAWDVNILADDVHFETASIISQIRMRLAIAGAQTCKLWLFAATNSLPIHTVSFTNVPATNQYDVSTYDFDMQVQVPKDIYVGFSAQGDGWTANAVDYWSRGSVVNRGVAGTAGQYYYGSVAGEKLTAIFPSGDSSFGCVQILSAPASIDDVAVVTGHVHLAIAALPIYATNAVERSDTAGGTNWENRGTLPLGVETTTWSESNTAPTSAFYRVKSH
jgi:hypothetical protein